MSELINTQSHAFRHGLLTSASVFALVGALGTSPGALAASADADRPVVWVELGGQLERVDSAQTQLSPPFFALSPPNVLAPLVDAQRLPHYSIGGEGKLTFAPSDSDWIFSASVRYGRSNASRHAHYHSAHTTTQTFLGRQVTESGRPVERFGDGQSKINESHFLLDFQAGKDVGLGLFGMHGTSLISAGVRFAQFTSNAHVTLHARPSYHAGPTIIGTPNFPFHLHAAYFQNDAVMLQSRRSTTAIGPSLSWDASAPLVGSNTDMSIALDWGVNAAILFGRQRARVHHQTTSANIYEYPGGGYPSDVVSGYTNKPADQNRVRNVTIPNVGGFAGVSFRYLNAKVKFGYRGDFFFNAVDNGIDTRKSSTIGFYGPFATVSVGMGG